jgi:hypothetical protein
MKLTRVSVSEWRKSRFMENGRVSIPEAGAE